MTTAETIARIHAALVEARTPTTTELVASIHAALVAARS